MKTKVTVYLKSGVDLSTVVSVVKLEDLTKAYSKAIRDPDTVVVHQESNESSVQIIPVSNIAFVDLREVPE